jgi:hypothetical protein
MSKTQSQATLHNHGEVNPGRLLECTVPKAIRPGSGQILVVALAALMAFCPGIANARVYSKPQIANLIRNVEDGVDRFRDYLGNSADDARNRADSAKNNRTPNQSGRRKPQNSEARKEDVKNIQDELDDALGDLNRSTNRLRRKFDMTDTWMETKVQVEKVVDDGRRVNQIMTRGRYGTQAERYWGALRTAINDLARAYGVPPLGI